MNNSLRGRDYLNIHDLSSEDFRYLIDLAWNLKAQKKSGVDQRYFPGKNVLANFEWGSTRTRCAFETSCNDLGMGFTYLTNSHMGDCETIEDAMRVFNGMYDLIVYRAQKDEQFLYDVADLVDIPVINALTLGDHPTQMLADALTMEEQWGGLRTSRGKKMAFVGNCAGAPVWYGRLCAMLDMDFLAIGPDDLRHQMCKEMIEEVEACYAKYAPNRTFTITSDLDALDGVDVIVTEEWRYINPECGDEVLDPDDYNSWLGDAESLYPYRVTSELCKRTNNPDIFCMHELPLFTTQITALARCCSTSARTTCIVKSSPRALRLRTSALRPTRRSSSVRQRTVSTPLRPLCAPFWVSRSCINGKCKVKEQQGLRMGSRDRARPHVCRYDRIL